MIELDDEDIEEEHDFELNFQKCKDKFNKVVDQVLYDVNCINFFDKSKKSQINEYFDGFKLMINLLIVELKNNFSKM